MIKHGFISGTWVKGLCLNPVLLTCCQCFSEHLTCWCCWVRTALHLLSYSPLEVFRAWYEFSVQKRGAVGFRKEITVCLYSRSFISLCFCLGLCIAVSLWISRQSLLRLDHLQRSFSWAQSLHSHEIRQICRLFMCLTSSFTSKKWS